MRSCGDRPQQQLAVGSVDWWGEGLGSSLTLTIVISMSLNFKCWLFFPSQRWLISLTQLKSCSRSTMLELAGSSVKLRIVNPMIPLIGDKAARAASKGEMYAADSERRDHQGGQSRHGKVHKGINIKETT
jgi:hypothetical protein